MQTLNKDPFQFAIYPNTGDPNEFLDLFEFMKSDFEAGENIIHGQSAEIISKPHLEEFPQYIGEQEPFTGGRFIVGPCAEREGDQLYLQREVADFASLFILSTLARYRHELWTDIIRGEKSGNVGLVALHLNAIQRRFPHFALQMIYDEPFGFGTPSYWS